MTQRRRGRLLTAVIGAVAAGLLAVGCGGDDEGGGDPFILALDFYVNPDHAGVYRALEGGDFAEVGLAVEAEVPSDPSAPIRQVAAGQVDLAISYEPEVLLAREQGLPVVAVAALVSRPLTSLISLPEAGIAEPGDLAGKTIATAGIPYQAAFLAAILEDAGLTPDDVDQVEVGLNLLPAVLSGRADAMLGGFLNVEGVDLEKRGKDPLVVPVDELGIPTYNELVLVANTKRVESDPEPIRRFIAALEGGTRDAVADPKLATEGVLAAGDGLEPKLTAAEVKRTLPLLVPSVSAQPFGYMDPGEWAAFAAFMAERGLIETSADADQALTNELLPAD
jgi:putative hydroxymethylpyrimidine transport system substrate-binding protein